jgi:Ca-activated chloride channel homolog
MKHRPPLALAIVVDRSGSMHGAPIEHAKAAALSMLQQLDRRDSFAVITYSSGSETVIPMQPATDENKIAARTAIATIDDDGGTCMSCGLETGAYEISHSSVRDGLRRILLISDGQANEGVHDRDELSQLAARKAADGVSISTAGVGLDFDERAMRRLAELGRGNYYFVEDTVALSAMFARELGSLTTTIASGVQLIVHPAPGIRIDEVYGYPMTRGSNGDVFVPVADIRAGQTRKVVLRATVTSARTESRAIVPVEVRWASLSDHAGGAGRTAQARAEADIVDDPAAVAASVDPTTMQAVERALSARALEDAAAAYDRKGLSGAREILERRSQAMRANAAYLDSAAIEELDTIAGEAMEGFASSPANAKKTVSVKSYELAR